MFSGIAMSCFFTNHIVVLTDVIDLEHPEEDPLLKAALKEFRLSFDEVVLKECGGVTYIFDRGIGWLKP